MGCSNADPSCDEDESPPKKFLSINHFLGKYEVTREKYPKKFISETGYKTDAKLSVLRTSGKLSWHETKRRSPGNLYKLE